MVTQRKIHEWFPHHGSETMPPPAGAFAVIMVSNSGQVGSRDSPKFGEAPSILHYVPFDQRGAVCTVDADES